VYSYFRATTVQEAVSRYATTPDAAYLAGGQSLLSGFAYRPHLAAGFIDVRTIPQLRQIELGLEGVQIGAAVTLNEIMTNRNLREVCPLLPDASAYVANHSVRNRSTIGGHVAFADGRSEVNLALLVTGATLVTSEREIPIRSAIAGHRRSTLHPGELITGLWISNENLRGRYGVYEFTLRSSGGRALVAATVKSDASGARPATGVIAAISGITPAPLLLESALGRNPMELIQNALSGASQVSRYHAQLAIEALLRAGNRISTAFWADT
jgi:carbon-monoxide dehydrogenase medium subunit